MMRGFTALPDTMMISMLKRSAALFVTLSLALSAAQAADKPKESSFGKGKPGGPLLTKAQLRDCLAQQERVRAQTEETVRLQAALERDKTEITKLGDLLKEQLAALDRGDANAVDAYNAQAQNRDKMIDDYEARAAVQRQGGVLAGRAWCVRQGLREPPLRRTRRDRHQEWQVTRATF